MRKLLLCLAITAFPAMLPATPLETVLPGAELRGQATLRYYGLALLQARLYSPEGRPVDWQDEMALEFTYLRKFTESDLVKSTMMEFTRNGAAPPVEDQLARCFDDVGRGDRYLAVSNGPDQVMFWRNQQPMCTLSHPGVKNRFMAIFLGENTQSPAFTRKLLGQ